jgi:hypothetical protein
MGLEDAALAELRQIFQCNWLIDVAKKSDGKLGEQVSPGDTFDGRTICLPDGNVQPRRQCGQSAATFDALNRRLFQARLDDSSVSHDFWGSTPACSQVPASQALT